MFSIGFVASTEVYPGLAVAATSAIAKTTTSNLGAIEIFDTGLLDRERTHFAGLVENLWDGQVTFHDVCMEEINRLPKSERLSLSVYAKLFAGDLTSAERLLLLDTDILVQLDLSELADLDLGEATLAASQEAIAIDKLSKTLRDRFNLAESVPYINSGLLVIDAARYRTTNAKTRMLQLAMECGADFECCDQDAINIELKNDILVLPDCWNKLSNTPNCFEWPGKTLHANLHYCGRNKPWHFQNQNMYGVVKQWWDVASTIQGLEAFLGDNRIPVPGRVARAKSFIKRVVSSARRRVA